MIGLNFLFITKIQILKLKFQEIEKKEKKKKGIGGFISTIQGHQEGLYYNNNNNNNFCKKKYKTHQLKCCDYKINK